VTAFADTWLSLDAYDKDDLVAIGKTKKQVVLTAKQLNKFLDEFKKELVKKGEATDIFGTEVRRDTVTGIVGNVMQSFGGKALYPTIEEKAAHLLYFMIKNHPFIDGNKRSGAFAFVWFLKKAGLLERSRITPPALTALTLFIAESDPKNKERMIKVVLQLLK
jgi:prophage maintenance system killer protein